MFTYESHKSSLVPCKQVCTWNMKMEDSCTQNFINDNFL